MSTRLWVWPFLAAIAGCLVLKYRISTAATTERSISAVRLSSAGSTDRPPNLSQQSSGATIPRKPASVFPQSSNPPRPPFKQEVKAIEIDLNLLSDLRVALFVPGHSILNPEAIAVLRLGKAEQDRWTEAIERNKKLLVDELDSTANVTETRSGLMLAYKIGPARVDEIERRISAELERGLDADSQAIFRRLNLKGISTFLLGYSPESISVAISNRDDGLTSVSISSKGRYGSAQRTTEGTGAFIAREFYGERAIAELTQRSLLPSGLKAPKSRKDKLTDGSPK